MHSPTAALRFTPCLSLTFLAPTPAGLRISRPQPALHPRHQRPTHDRRRARLVLPDGDNFPIHRASITPQDPRPTRGSRAFPTEKRTMPAGEWNRRRVESNTSRITLQKHGSPIQFAASSSRN